MARKEKTAPVVTDPVSPESTAGWSEGANQLVAINRDREEKVKGLATKLNYSGSTHPDALEAIATDATRHAEASLFALGISLILLKESCEHGDFISRLDRIGVESRVAQKSMQQARKFANTPTSAYFQSLGKSKLLELIVLDDEQIEELASTGQTGTLELDDLATMSVKELRAAVRNLRGDIEAKDKVLDDTQKKLTKLQVQVKKKVAADTDWPEALAPICEQVAAAGRKLATALSELEVCRITVFEVGASIPEEDGAQRAKFEAALGHLSGLHADALLSANKLVAKEQLAFENTLGNFLPE